MGAQTPMSCPTCGAGLRAEHAKMNVRVRSCPRNHGLFLGGDALDNLMAEQTKAHLLDELAPLQELAHSCPGCGHHLRGFHMGDVPAEGCADCGSLWFDYAPLQSHVLDVRRRAFGANSLAARADVHQTGTPMHAAEVVAGLVTDYELELDESSSIV